MNTLMKCLTLLIIINNCVAVEEEPSVSTEYLTLCDENSTCSTYDLDENTSVSTEDGMYINTTDTPFSNETTNATISTTPKPEIKYDVTKTDLEYCPCNTQRDYCDINCCCDTDCTVEQTLVFSDCESTITSYYDPKYCHSVEYKYINNTKMQFDIYENGLFCIVSSNLPAHYFVQADKPIVSLRKAEKAISSRYKWPKMPYKIKDKFNNTLSFKYGQQIWFHYNELEIIPFSLPNNFISFACSRRTYVQFLKDIKTSCRLTFIDESNIAINAGTYFANITVLSLPKLLNTTLDENYFQDCPNNICLKINVFLCDETFDSCDEMYSNDTKINASCHSSIFSNEQTCLFVTKKVKYIFYHNGTNGLTNVDLFIHLTNLTYFLNEDHEFIQSFEVKFMWSDYENEVNFSSLLSGNPGYLIGKPILFGHLNDTTGLNESIKVPKYELARNDCDVTKNLLVLPKNVNDYCVLNNQTYVQIDFGYNLRLHCIQKIVFNKTNTNASDICIYMQQQIFELWQIDVTSNHSDPQKLVGMFGNSNRLVISEWIEILYKFQVRMLLEKIDGHFRDDELVCQNLADTLRINIIFGQVDFEHAKQQAKILNTFFEVEETPKSEFTMIYDDVLQQYIADVHLFMEVMFFDVTYHKIKKFVDPPTFQIKLPHDFFYPFTLGGQNILQSNYYLVFIVLYIIL